MIKQRYSPEFYFRFVLWITSLSRMPDRKAIQSRFEVSKPTACRWLRAWKDVNGVA